MTTDEKPILEYGIAPRGPTLISRGIVPLLISSAAILYMAWNLNSVRRYPFDWSTAVRIWHPIMIVVAMTLISLVWSLAMLGWGKKPTDLATWAIGVSSLTIGVLVVLFLFLVAM